MSETQRTDLTTRCIETSEEAQVMARIRRTMQLLEDADLSIAVANARGPSFATQLVLRSPEEWLIISHLRGKKIDEMKDAASKLLGSRS